MRLLGGLAALALVHLSACSCGDDDAVIDAAPGFDAAEIPDAVVADATPDPAPGPVTDLTATPSGADGMDLSWTNPTDADFAGVVIVRRLADPGAAAPVDGTSYAVDDTLAAGETVIYAGTGTAVSDSGLPPGVIHYTAYAMDDATQWLTPAARAFGLVAAAPQTATLTVDLTPAGVVVSAQPADHVLGATVVYDDPGDSITVTLTVTNGFARNTFAPKAVITAVNQGTITGDGDLDGDPFVRLGQGLAPAGMGSGDLVFTGIDGSVDPITIDVTVVDSPVGVVFGRYNNDVAYELIDTATLSTVGTVDCDGLRFTGPTDANANLRCSYRSGAISADGRRLYTGHRSLPVVRAIDPATGTVVMTLSLDAGIGTVRHVALDAPGTTLYASLTTGGHTYYDTINGDIGTIQDHVLVAIDAASMTERARLVIGDDVATDWIRLGRAAFSPDGSRIALAERDQDSAILHVIDAATLALVDTDTVTAGVQSLDLSAQITTVKNAVFTADGSAIVVQGAQSDMLVSIDATTFAPTAIPLPGGEVDTTDSGALVALTGDTVLASYSPGGVGTPASFAVVDGTSVTEGGDIGRAIGIAVHGDRIFALTDSGGLRVYELAGLAEIGTGTSLDSTPLHELLFTPF